MYGKKIEFQNYFNYVDISYINIMFWLNLNGPNIYEIISFLWSLTVIYPPTHCQQLKYSGKVSRLKLKK